MYALLFKQLKCAVIQAIKMLNILISVFFFLVYEFRYLHCRNSSSFY